MKPVKYTRHAKNRMLWRRITEEEIESAINDPDFSEHVNDDKKNVWKKVLEKYLRVTYKEDAKKILVITAVKKRKGWG